ncbi:MAG: multicopper oxidase domain-containing protein [Gemmatimonadaceae bacterium]
MFAQPVMLLAIAAAVSTLAQSPTRNSARMDLASSGHSRSAATARALPNDNRTAAGRLIDGVLTLSLEARAVDWYPEDSSGPAVPVYAFAEVDQPATIPGPMIRVPLGTEVRVSVHNALGRRLVLRGLQHREGATLDSIVLTPDSTREVRFRADVPGTYFYWGRTEPIPPLPIPGRGRDASLVGALIVDTAETTRENDRVLVITMWADTSAALGIKSDYADKVLRREGVPRDGWLLFAVNGKSWPHTERLSYTAGDTIRWRVINGVNFPHPMHLHGFHFNVTSRGTALADTLYAAAQKRVAVTEWMTAGTTLAMTWVPDRAGNWLFHCHFVTHISDANRPHKDVKQHDVGGNHAEQGMAGLVVGIHVRPSARSIAAHEAAPKKRLRLFITEKPNVFGSQPAYSYILQEGPKPPAADSVRPVGSTLVLRQHEPTQITVLNATTHATSIHWHGIELESYYDGVGQWSGWQKRIAPIIAPGDSFVVRLTPPRAGTFMYHTHVSEGIALASGLYGALIVLPENAPSMVRDYVVLFSIGGPHDEARPLVNGSTEPAPFEVKAGARHRFRFINISPLESPTVRLVADSVVQEWRALAKDGAELPAVQASVRPALLVIRPGETYDFEITPASAGPLALTVTSIETLANREAARLKQIQLASLPRIVTRIPLIVR